MAINYALTTKTRVKSRLAITTTSFDDLFDFLIAGVTDKIEQMAGRRFLATTYTDELYDGTDIYNDRQSIIVINNAPVLNLTRIQYKSGANSDPVWYTYTEDDYDLNETNGIVYMKGNLPSGKQNVRMTYQAGYKIHDTDIYNTASHTLPFDIMEVCEEVVTRLFKRRESEGRTNESFQESSITWSDGVFTKENLNTINNYRRAILWSRLMLKLRTSIS